MKRALSRKTCAAIIVVLIGLTAAAEFALGRRLWGAGGQPGLWSGDIWSEHNSQFVADPYSFTHIAHGVLFYALVKMVAPKASLPLRLVMVVALEGGWEVIENTNAAIERYRTATISLNYFGDSVVNSVCDVLLCML